MQYLQSYFAPRMSTFRGIMKIFILSLVLTIPFSNGGDHGADDGGGDRAESHPPPEKDDGGDFADAESNKGNQTWQPDHAEIRSEATIAVGIIR